MAEIKLDTSLGEIIAKSVNSKDYPGIYVSLMKDGETLAEVMLEVDQSEEESVCKIHVWDTTNDEPICDLHGYVNGESLELEEY